MTSGLPAPSHTTWSFEFRPPLVRPIQRGRAPFLEGLPPCDAPSDASNRYDALRLGTLAREAREDSIEDAQSAPADEAVVERFVRPLGFGRILPLQAVADHVDNAADDPSIIDARHAMRKREMRRNPRHLTLSQKEQANHRTAPLNGTLNHASINFNMSLP